MIAHQTLLPLPCLCWGVGSFLGLLGPAVEAAAFVTSCAVSLVSVAAGRGVRMARQPQRLASCELQPVCCSLIVLLPNYECNPTRCVNNRGGFELECCFFSSWVWLTAMMSGLRCFV
ncbi:hypothetical protein COO60DRAFT_1524459, partial [Scenedesmus sp. NREL 46B-D3]